MKGGTDPDTEGTRLRRLGRKTREVRNSVGKKTRGLLDLENHRETRDREKEVVTVQEQRSG